MYRRSASLKGNRTPWCACLSNRQLEYLAGGGPGRRSLDRRRLSGPLRRPHSCTDPTSTRRSVDLERQLPHRPAEPPRRCRGPASVQADDYATARQRRDAAAPCARSRNRLLIMRDSASNRAATLELPTHLSPFKAHASRRPGRRASSVTLHGAALRSPITLLGRLARRRLRSGRAPAPRSGPRSACQAVRGWPVRRLAG